MQEPFQPGVTTVSWEPGRSAAPSGSRPVFSLLAGPAVSCPAPPASPAARGPGPVTHTSSSSSGFLMAVWLRGPGHTYWTSPARPSDFLHLSGLRLWRNVGHSGRKMKHLTPTIRYDRRGGAAGGLSKSRPIRTREQGWCRWPRWGRFQVLPSICQVMRCKKEGEE